MSVLNAAITLDWFPYLQDVGSDHAVVMWTTLQQGGGRVEVTADRGFSRTYAAVVREFLPSETGRSTAFYQYTARLTGLSEAVQYNYRVNVDGETSELLRFRTPARTGPVTFLAFGDSGDGSAAQSQLASLIAAEDVQLMLHTGDLAYPNGTYQQLEQFFFTPYRDILSRTPVFLTAGNHEYYTRDGAPYFSVTSPPVTNAPASEKGRYYSFDWGDVHFICLDSNLPLVRSVAGTSTMLQWLEDDLQRSRKFWRIAFFHHPPYPTSDHHQNDQLSAMVRQHLVPVLERHGVPLVISGHDHNYQRSVPMSNGVRVPEGTGTQYVVTGGGGANLFSLPESPLVAKGVSISHYTRFEIEGAKATVRAKDMNGVEFDRAVLAPAPLVGANTVVNAATFTAAIAPGGLVTIYGRNLAYREAQAAAFPLPLSLLGVSVSINGQPIPLTYVAPDQINAQVPFTVSGNASVTITTPNGTATAPIAVLETAPGIFVGGAPAIIHGNGSLVTIADPAVPGEFLSIFTTGLGRVNSTIGAGQPAPSAPLATVVNSARVRLGNSESSPTFAGLAPGYAGLYQVVIQVPNGTRDGLYPLEISSRGATSNLVLMPVNSSGRGPSPAAEGRTKIGDLLRTFSIQPGSDR